MFLLSLCRMQFLVLRWHASASCQFVSSQISFVMCVLVFCNQRKWGCNPFLACPQHKKKLQMKPVILHLQLVGIWLLVAFEGVIYMVVSWNLTHCHKKATTCTFSVPISKGGAVQICHICNSDASLEEVHVLCAHMAWGIYGYGSSSFGNMCMVEL